MQKKMVPLILSLVAGLCFLISFSAPFVCSDFGLSKVKYVDVVDSAMTNPCQLMEESIRGTSWGKGLSFALAKGTIEELCNVTIGHSIKGMATNTTDDMLGYVTHPISKEELDWNRCINDVAPEFDQDELGTCVSKEKSDFQTCMKWWMVGQAGIPIGTQTIMSVIQGLFQSNDVLLGFLIVIFSILFPISKITLSLVLCFQKKISKTSLKMLTLSSKWSMTDVFVVALLITFFKAESFNFHFQAEYGVYLFAAAAILSSISVMILEQEYTKERKQDGLDT